MRKLTTAMVVLTCTLLCVPIYLNAQSREEQSAAQAPILPLMVHFRLVPEYFTQLLENDPLFSKIEAFVDNDPRQPWYEVVLTYKATGASVFYCNSQQWVRVLRNAGWEAYAAPIEFAGPGTAESRPMYRIDLHDRFGEEIRWQFVPSLLATPGGNAFISQPDTFGFMLIHATHRAPAGAGTVLTIGGHKNIGVIGTYQAYYATDLTVAALIPGTELWSVESRPINFAKGETWTLQSEDGQERFLSIERTSDNQVSINQTERQDAQCASVELEVQQVNNSLTLRSVTLTLQTDVLRISFKPELPFPTPTSADRTNVDFSMTENQTIIASGKLLVLRAFDAEHLLWMFDAPDWAKEHSFETGANVIPSVQRHDSGWTRCVVDDCSIMAPAFQGVVRGRATVSGTISSH
jgi:hypothetical protein